MLWDKSIIDCKLISESTIRKAYIKVKGGMTATLEYKLFEPPYKTSLRMINIASPIVIDGGGSWTYQKQNYGTPDNTFGVNGFVTTDINPTFQDYNAMTIAADGKIICAGRTNNATTLNDIAVVRYNNDLSTSVTEIEKANEVSVFPNPV